MAILLVLSVIAGCGRSGRSESRCLWIPDQTGWTPLHHAAASNALEIVQLLVEKGHPLDCPDLFGYTPLDRAWGQGPIVNRRVIAFLLTKGASFQVFDK